MFAVTIGIFTLFHYAICANILGVFWIPSYSHQIVYQPIWRELSLRGHQVTVITPNPLNDPSLVNLTEISVSFTYDIWKEMMTMYAAEIMDMSIFYSSKSAHQFLEIIIDAELSSPEVKKLIADKNKQFDVILIEILNPTMYGLAGRFKAPTITVSSLGLPITTHDLVGNPAHPYLYPDFMLNFHDKNLSLWQKVKSIAYSIWCRYVHQQLELPSGQKLAEKHFGNDIPYIGDIEKNTSLLFMNTNPLLYPPRPLVPAVVQLGQMHIRPVKPLPQDLQQILDNSKDGVIYFSLGTNVNKEMVSDTLLKNMIDAMSELPYTVLWKFDTNDLPSKPKNVIIRQWLPQQDVLAHPNIKAFVTQGGLQSAEEAISRRVPMVGIPFFADQPMNVQKMVDLGIGIGVDTKTVTKDELKAAILEVVQNNRYKEKIVELNDILYDKPMTGLENAVWWTEYVIRHKGARHLRSPTADISWLHYLLLDVIASIIAGVFILVYVANRLIRKLKVSARRKQKSN